MRYYDTARGPLPRQEKVHLRTAQATTIGTSSEFVPSFAYEGARHWSRQPSQGGNHTIHHPLSLQYRLDGFLLLYLSVTGLRVVELRKELGGFREHRQLGRCSRGKTVTHCTNEHLVPGNK